MPAAALTINNSVRPTVEQPRKLRRWLQSELNVTASPVSDEQRALGSWEPRLRWQHVFKLVLAHRRSAGSEVDQLLADDPRSVFGHCLRAALIVRADDACEQERLNASIASIMRACPETHHQAHRHALAARAWATGDSAGVAELYGAIVIDFPRDILALMAAHALDFRLGRRLLLRDRIAQVLPEWEPGMLGYSSVLAMYAFGLEAKGWRGRLWPSIRAIRARFTSLLT